MIVAGIALVVALTGTGVAAVLVTSSQIADETILSRDVKNGALASADIKNGTIAKADLSAALQSQLVREVVSNEGVDAIPATLTNQFPLSNNLALSSKTTRTGRLWISARMSADVVCDGVAGEAWFYLMVDGKVVRSSIRRVAVDTDASSVATSSYHELTGVTSSRVAPGAHTVTVGIQCDTGVPTASAYWSNGRAQTVVVLE